MTTPAIRALAQSLPQSEIHFLTQSPSDQIYRHNPYISKIIKIPGKPKLGESLKLLRQLRKERYSTVIDFLGLPNTALISWLIGAKKRIGFKLRGRSLFYTHPIQIPTHLSYSATHKLYLLSGLNITTDDAKLDFYITDKERNAGQQVLKKIGATQNFPVISISPVSRRTYKIWPAEYFAAICDYLAECYNAQILFLWGPGEYHFIKKVKDLMKRPSLPRYEVPTIAETVGLLEQIDLHVGNDNGPMHFAVAAGVPSIGIFGRPLLKNWIPPNSKNHLGVEFDPGCKNDCFYPKCGLECLRGVTVKTVIEKIDFLMAELGYKKPSRP
ncbi:glycosyltransferase family 9 protein [bacterium]|nr:glycosyltransferase family 9 protein [bacterium]